MEYLRRINDECGAPLPSEKQWLAEWRKAGNDWQFQHHLLRQRVRILGAVLMRDAVAPWATPVLALVERGMARVSRG